VHTWGDGKCWVLFVACHSTRHWTATKQRLGFCTVTQDGDDEGCLRLRQLPTVAQASVIRDALGIRKRADLSAEELERRRALGKRLAQASGRANATSLVPHSLLSKRQKFQPSRPPIEALPRGTALGLPLTNSSDIKGAPSRRAATSS